MRKGVRLALVGAIGALYATPAPAAGMMDFGMSLTPDARIPMGDRTFNIWMSRKKGADEFLVQTDIKNAFTNTAQAPDVTWQALADAFVKPVGCGVESIHAWGSMKSGASWVAKYVCPDGVDLKKLVKQQHAALMRGEPLTAAP